MLDTFIDDLLNSIVHHDAPKHLSPTKLAALKLRISRYQKLAGTLLGLYLCYLVGLIIFLIIWPNTPGPFGGTWAAAFGFYMLLPTLGIGLFNMIASIIRPLWSFDDFHAAFAYHADLGSRGLYICLAGWFIILSGMFLADSTF